VSPSLKSGGPRYDTAIYTVSAHTLAVTILAALLAVLTLAPSAWAQSAWALWAEQRRSTRDNPHQQTSVEQVNAYTTLQECAAKLDSLQSAGDQRWGPAMLYRVIGDPKVEVIFITWQCLPDTVDPRRPKGSAR
jgi:hypothetical protein